MSNITLSSETKEIQVQSSVVLSMNHSSITVLVEITDDVNGVLPLEFIRLKLLSGVQWEYKIKSKDGRVWTQAMIINPGEEELISFNTSAQWKSSELSNHRNLREYLVKMIRTFGLMYYKAEYH